MSASKIWQRRINVAIGLFLILLCSFSLQVFQDKLLFRNRVFKQLYADNDKLEKFESKWNSKLEDLEKKISAKSEKEVIVWSKGLLQKGFKMFSQNDEDGVIEAVFDYIGTTNKVYVEFGVESCIECNTRYLREKKEWNVNSSLLMDGSHENPSINLKKVIFWPTNIVDIFKLYGVKKKFDLLSVDTDSYDFFMLENILEAKYAPRVIVIEYNSHFEISEAKSILPPADGKSWLRWDGSRYQGMSLLAISYLFNRFSYSLVWCNKVNCIGVRDEALGIALRRPATKFLGPRLDQHKCDRQMRPMAMIDESGKWNGSTDNGNGSQHIRCS